MPEYTREEARDWARQEMKGVAGCMMPTLNSSLTKINEAAIRHDIRLEAELGFWGTLLVSECGTTMAEMREVIDISVDEASKVGLRTILQGSFATLDDTIEMVRYADSAGCDLVLLSYPLMFRPRSEDDVYDFTRAVAEASDLGIFLFCIGLWDFTRFHPNGFSPQLIDRLVTDVPNVIAIKDEVGPPGVAGIAEVFRRFKDEVVVTDPFEMNAPAWTSTFGMQFMGTSNYEYMGREVPVYFDLLQEDRFDDAMEIYWKLHPARIANSRVMGEFHPTGLVHRLAWKYEYWLNGFNGGPVRQPHSRVFDRQMKSLRQGLEATGIPVTESSDEEFFVGRNPIE